MNYNFSFHLSSIGFSPPIPECAKIENGHNLGTGQAQEAQLQLEEQRSIH